MSMLRYPLVFAHANGFTGASYRALLSPLAAHFELHPLERLAHDPDFPVGRNWLALREEYHLMSVLCDLKVPLTVIAGEDSDLLTPNRRRPLERLGIRLRCVPGGHMFPFERPQVTRQAILEAIGHMLGEAV